MVAVVSLALAREGLAQTRTDAAAPDARPAETPVYRPDGRRDPFVSLVAAAAEPRIPSRRIEGLEGFMTSEIAVRGILRSQNATVAMIQAPATQLVRLLQEPGARVVRLVETLRKAKQDGQE